MLRKIFPKTLFVRSLIIVIAPILLMQVVIGSVFFDSLWFKTHKALVRITAGEINAFLVLYPEFEKKNQTDKLIKTYSEKNGIQISFKTEINCLPS